MTLQDGWTSTTLAQLLSDGLFIDGDWVETKDQNAEGDVRLTQLADVGDGTWRNRSDRRLTRETAARLRCTYLIPGDVLVARMPDPLGRACIFPGDERPAITVVDVCIMRPNPERVCAPWLMMYMNSPAMRAKIAALQAGTTRKRISRRNLGGISLTLPPLREQRVIVSKAEEFLSHLSAAESSVSRARKNLTRLQVATLRTVLFPDVEQRVTVSSIASVGSGATPLRSRRDYYDGGTIPWVTSGQLVNDYVDEPAEYITERALSETAVKLWPVGTLLVAMYGEGRTRGHCSELRIAATTNQACAAIVVNDLSPVHPAFLKLFLKASYEDNRRLAAGGVQPNLSLGLIKNMEIPCPTIEVQKQIVADVTRQLSGYEALDSQIQTVLQRVRKLRASILDAAYNGQFAGQQVQMIGIEPSSRLATKANVLYGAES